MRGGRVLCSCLPALLTTHASLGRHSLETHWRHTGGWLWNAGHKLAPSCAPANGYETGSQPHLNPLFAASSIGSLNGRRFKRSSVSAYFATFPSVVAHSLSYFSLPQPRKTSNSLPASSILHHHPLPSHLQPSTPSHTYLTINLLLTSFRLSTSIFSYTLLSP